MNTLNSTFDFLSVNPKLRELFNMTGMYDQWDPLNNFSTGFQVRPGLLNCSGIANPDLIKAYLADLRQIASQAVSADLIASPADKVFLFMAGLGMNSEADSFFDPTINRPGLAFSEIVGIGNWLGFIRANYNSGIWVSPEIQRGMLTHFLLSHPGSLIESYANWFGPNSVGWLNEDERVATLEAFKGAMSNEAKNEYAKIWQDAGGDDQFITYWWPQYLKQMKLVKKMVMATSFKQNVRRGYQAYEEKLKRLGIKHSIDEIWEWARERYDEVNAEMERIAQKSGYLSWREMWEQYVPQNAPKSGELVQWYNQIAPGVIQTLIDNGLIQQASDWGYNIVKTPPDMVPSIPLAACLTPSYKTDDGSQRNATFYVTVTKDRKLIRDHVMSGRLTIAHEVGGHSWGGGLAPHIVPVDYTSNFDTYLIGLEGVAFSMEAAYVQCKGVNPHPAELLAMLQGRLWRYGRIMAECEWHLGSDPLEAIVERYRDRSNISHQMAQRDMRRAAQEIWQFVVYAFGASGVSQMSSFYAGGFKEALADYQASTGGYIPPHLYLEAVGRIPNAAAFNWLCPVDEGVATTRQLIP
jgi:hypothetical protein